MTYQPETKPQPDGPWTTIVPSPAMMPLTPPPPVTPATPATPHGQLQQFRWTPYGIVATKSYGW